MIDLSPLVVNDIERLAVHLADDYCSDEHHHASVMSMVEDRVTELLRHLEIPSLAEHEQDRWDAYQWELAEELRAGSGR